MKKKSLQFGAEEKKCACGGAEFRVLYLKASLFFGTVCSTAESLKNQQAEEIKTVG